MRDKLKREGLKVWKMSKEKEMIKETQNIHELFIWNKCTDLFQMDQLNNNICHLHFDIKYTHKSEKDTISLQCYAKMYVIYRLQ